MRSRITTRCRFAWRSATLTDCSTKLAYTFAHALDNASSASLGSVNNGDFQDQRYPDQNYGNADFDVRQRLVFSYVYDLPFGHGRTYAARIFRRRESDYRQLANDRCFFKGHWQLLHCHGHQRSFPVATAAARLASIALAPMWLAIPTAKPCIAGTLFNTCAFADNTDLGTFGNAGRNIIEGPGYTEWDTSLVKQFPIKEQKHLEFRAEFFNVLNHVNYLFGQFGAISAEPTPLELNRNQSSFGFPLAARAPRQIQFALKFYF